MQAMLEFLIITILFIAAGIGALSIFYAMIQEGGALDLVFGWQKMLDRLYRSEKKSARLLENALGGCQRCTAFWFMPVWYLCYALVSKCAFHVWITSRVHNWALVIIINVIWYALYHIIGAMAGYKALLKFFKK